MPSRNHLLHPQQQGERGEQRDPHNQEVLGIVTGAEKTKRMALSILKGWIRGRDVYITHARRTIEKLPVSKLHPCKIGNWGYS